MAPIPPDRSRFLTVPRPSRPVGRSGDGAPETGTLTTTTVRTTGTLGVPRPAQGVDTVVRSTVGPAPRVQTPSPPPGTPTTETVTETDKAEVKTPVRHTDRTPIPVGRSLVVQVHMSDPSGTVGTLGGIL